MFTDAEMLLLTLTTQEKGRILCILFLSFRDYLFLWDRFIVTKAGSASRGPNARHHHHTSFIYSFLFNLVSHLFVVGLIVCSRSLVAHIALNQAPQLCHPTRTIVNVELSLWSTDKEHELGDAHGRGWQDSETHSPLVSKSILDRCSFGMRSLHRHSRRKWGIEEKWFSPGPTGAPGPERTF